MKNDRRMAEPPLILSGWKEIANYLGKGVRTVQRYERSMGFPIRRPAGKAAGSVVAIKAEVDAWVVASPFRDAFQLGHLSHPENMADEITRGVESMKSLRHEMMELQHELRSSVQVLRDTLSAMQGDLHENRWSEPANRVTVLSEGDLKSNVLKLLATDPRRKAS